MKESAAEASRPAFIVTIDTEGDDAWGRHPETTTRNSAFVPRFQSLCEKYGLKPTYLVNWEMSQCPVFRSFGKDLLKRGRGEIGMHLHAWNSPPIVPLTENDHLYHPYSPEYPEEILRKKVQHLTSALEETFEVRMVSHRAGRWSMDEVYAGILAERGYQVDCSVTPRISWRDHPGKPGGRGGADYSTFPDRPYFLDLKDISREGSSNLLEVPLTVASHSYPPIVRWTTRALGATSLGERVRRRFFPAYSSLRPTGRNLSALLAILETAAQDAWDYVEFMLHSSEMMPGGSPNFRDSNAIEKLYQDLKVLFSSASERFSGMTLAEYRDRYVAQSRRSAQN